MEEVEFCQNCKKHIPAKNYVIHSVHCNRNIQLCDRCSVPVPRSEIEAHLEEYHSLDTCSECHISLEKWQIEKHGEICPRKLVPCEFCELEIPLDSLSEHCAACGSRTEKCLQCNKHVMIKDLQKHPRICSTKEPETMPCEFCDIQIPWNNFIEHIAICGTSTERCYMCNEHVMASDRATHFKACRNHCENEKKCSYCLKMFPYSWFEQHLETCPERSYTCEKCLRSMPYRQKEHHLKHTCAAQEKGFSTNAIFADNIPQDVKMDEDKKIVSASKTYGNCLVCHESVPWVDMNVHVAYCAQVYYETDDYERQNQMNEFVLKKGSHASNDMSIEGQQIQHFKKERECLYCLKMFSSSTFGQHLETCQERPYTCEKCLRAMCCREKENHLKHKCTAQEKASCSKNDYMSLDAETGDKEFVKLKKCNFCDKRFPDILLQPHLQECELKQRNCKFSYKDVPIKDKEKHIFQKCTDGSGNRNFSSNKYVSIMESTKNEEKMRYFEKNVETCPSCDSKIPEPKYEEHLRHCYAGKKPCRFCGLEMSEDQEFMHVRHCPKILEMEKAGRNYSSMKNKSPENEGKAVREGLISKMSSWMSGKRKDGETNNKSEKAFESTPFVGTNKGNSFERSNMALAQSPVILPMENTITLLPCEFCNEMYPCELIIEHQSGCRPDLVSYPKTKEAGDDSQKFAIAAASSETFYMPALSASQERVNEGNEWKLQSKRKNRTFNTEKDDFVSQNVHDRNRHQKQLTATDNFFYLPPQDNRDVKKKTLSSCKKRYPQLKENVETPKTKPIEEIGAIHAEKDDLNKKQFTSFKFRTSRLSEDNDDFVEKSEYGTNINKIKITFDESSKGSQPSKFPESTQSRSMPAVWNVEYGSDKDNTFRSAFAKSYPSSNNNETKFDIVNNSVENTDPNGLNSSMRLVSEAGCNTRNDVTFGEADVNKQNTEDENCVISNSDEIFYDANDESASYFDSYGGSCYGSINTPLKKLENFIDSNQKANTNQVNYKDLSTDIEMEEDSNNKDSDLDGYFQFLHGSIKQSPKAAENQINEVKNLSLGTVGNCRQDNKSFHGECSASLQETSYADVHSFEDASCVKSYHEPVEIEQFGKTKISSQMKCENGVQQKHQTQSDV